VLLLVVDVAEPALFSIDEEELFIVPCDCGIGAHEQHAMDAISRRE